jgi:hypothetical protein
VERASSHRNINRQSVAIDVACGKCNRKTCRQPVVFAPVFLDPRVGNAPLEEFEAVAAKLALEGVEIKEPQQEFAETHPAYASDVFSRTPGTKGSRHRFFLWLAAKLSITARF